MSRRFPENEVKQDEYRVGWTERDNGSVYIKVRHEDGKRTAGTAWYPQDERTPMQLVQRLKEVIEDMSDTSESD